MPLTRRQAFVVTHARFGSDIDALAGQLGQVFKAGPATQANWSGFQAEMARFANQAAGAVQSAGVDTQKLTAGAQKAKSVAKAVGWSYLALIGGALVGGIVAVVLTGGRVESELGQGIIGVGGVLGVVVYWVRRKRRQ